MCILGLAVNKLAFNYFDIFVVLWLIVGVILGRKHGMSQEILPMLQWIGIMVAAAFFYRPLAAVFRQNTSLDMLWCVIFSYVLIGLGVHFVFLWIKKAVGEKLVGSDLFGRAEFYLGMAGGAVRFACMLVCLLALMNARIISKEELARTAKVQNQNFEGVSFPTYGSIQQAVLFESFSGHAAKENLKPLLIASVTPEAPRPKTDTMAKKQEQQLNEILGAPKK
ncbi:MAG TPA: CvpA family protein [Verrucomicrobiae bacterium]|nr:CvpA family protein [Verrucomicrobiae bacterium]